MDTKSENTLIETFCFIYEFSELFQKYNKKITKSKEKQKKPTRKPSLDLSEVLTILIFFQQYGHKTFKEYYNKFVKIFLIKYFPLAPSYSRFISLMKRAELPLLALFHCVKGKCTGISFIDSTNLSVCHNKRIYGHKVFKDIAQKGKSSMGWFFGFKFHAIINHVGEILAFQLSTGNVHDIAPVEKMCAGIFGKLFGDKGYISSHLCSNLEKKGIFLFTKIKKNMKGKLLNTIDRVLLNKRSVIESFFNKIKNNLCIDHHRHRSPTNLIIHLLSGLIAYCLDDKKPSIILSKKDSSILGSAC